MDTQKGGNKKRHLRHLKTSQKPSKAESRRILKMTGGSRHDLAEQQLTLRRSEGPVFRAQPSGFQKDTNSSHRAPYRSQQPFNNVLTKPPGCEPRGFSSNTCSSCSFCMKNSCACKSSDCATCVNAENLPKRGWSARGPPEEIYNYF